MTLTANLSGRLSFKETKTSGGVTVPFEPFFSLVDELGNGTGLDQGDLLYVDTDVSLAGSGTNSLDVNGALSSVYGVTISAVKLKLFYFHNKSVTAGRTITLGNDTNELLLWSAGATQTVGPNARVIIWEPSLAGIPVTATTGDILKILNDSASANTYDIGFVGASA